MKLLIFAVLSILFVSIQAQEGEKKDAYAAKFNDFDLDAVLNNGRVLQNYVKCLVGEGSCTKEGRELKSKSPYIFNYI